VPPASVEASVDPHNSSDLAGPPGRVRTIGHVEAQAAIAAIQSELARRGKVAVIAVGDDHGDPRFVGWGGGVPVIVNGSVVGSVAVSGLTHEEDAELAGLGAAAAVEASTRTSWPSRRGGTPTRRFDVHFRTYDNPGMADRVKRTYNVSPETLRRVRELAGDYGVAKSQDAVVELAVERLYVQMQELEEANRWAQAAEDQDFRAEMSALASDMDKRQSWPR
jgi:hypothetical protein